MPPPPPTRHQITWHQSAARSDRTKYYSGGKQPSYLNQSDSGEGRGRDGLPCGSNLTRRRHPQTRRPPRSDFFR